MKDLTEKQQKIFNYMKDNQIMSCPTYREIAKEFNITLKGAYDHVELIMKKGFLYKVGEKHSTKIQISGEHNAKN